MRILHIVDGIPPYALGGTGRIVTEIACGQRKAGNEVAILSAAKSGTLQGSIDGVEILTITPKSERWAHWRSVFSVSRDWEVMKKIDTFKPNVVHAHTISRQMGYGWMPKLEKRGIKLIVTCHDVSHVAYGKVLGTEQALWWTELKRHKWSYNPFRNVLIRHFLKSADKILAVSDSLKTYLEKRGLRNVTTLHNGIDLEFWKPGVSKSEARIKLKLPQGTFLFLLAGRMGVDKGSTLISATLPNDAHLVLAGDRFSDEFAPVKDRMHVFYNQSADDMKLQYAASDVVLVPSRCMDCFPTVCLEAMALQKPVIATSWGGAKESVKAGETGWILDPLNTQLWSEKMAWCMTHRAELETFGKAGRKRMEEKFSLPVMLQKLEEIYRR